LYLAFLVSDQELLVYHYGNYLYEVKQEVTGGKRLGMQSAGSCSANGAVYVSAPWVERVRIPAMFAQ
tara:strand:+ start:1763 stop:1963 length:201 start_codon:yes stop_codon:yes gene_type:complete